MGIAALVLGIIGLFICWIPIIGLLSYILVVIGLVLGIVDLCKKVKNKEKNGISIAGIVICGVAIPIIIFMSTVSSLVALALFTEEDGIIDESMEYRLDDEYYQDFYDDYYDYYYDGKYHNF